MATVSKADLTKTVANESGVSAKDAKTIIDAFISATETHLSQGDTVQLTGYRRLGAASPTSSGNLKSSTG